MEQIHVEILHADGKNRELVDQLKQSCRVWNEINSSDGIQIVSFILEIAQLVVTLLNNPLLMRALFRNEVKLIINGDTVNDPLEVVEYGLKRNPDMRREYLSAYKAGNLHIKECSLLERERFHALMAELESLESM